MRRFLGLGLFFIICLAITLALNMPLAHVLAQIKLPGNIRLNNLDGTLLNGRIDVIEVNRVQATGLKYSSDPGCLLTLEWCYLVSADQGQLKISAGALNRQLMMTDAHLTYAVAELLPLFPALLVKPTGEIDLRIDRMTFTQDKFRLSSGSIIWKQAGVEGEPVDLGEYRFNAALSNETYILTIKDNNALLKVDGRGQLKSNGQYSLDVKIESEPGLQNSVKTALEFLASKRGLNQYSVLQSGRLPPRSIAQLSFEQG